MEKYKLVSWKERESILQQFPSDSIFINTNDLKERALFNIYTQYFGYFRTPSGISWDMITDDLVDDVRINKHRIIYHSHGMSSDIFDNDFYLRSIFEGLRFHSSTKHGLSCGRSEPHYSLYFEYQTEEERAEKERILETYQAEIEKRG